MLQGVPLDQSQTHWKKGDTDTSYFVDTITSNRYTTWFCASGMEGSPGFFSSLRLLESSFQDIMLRSRQR
jgi:hypothetical protein